MFTWFDNLGPIQSLVVIGAILLSWEFVKNIWNVYQD